MTERKDYNSTSRNIRTNGRLRDGMKVLDNMYQAGLIANMIGAGFNRTVTEDRKDRSDIA